VARWCTVLPPSSYARPVISELAMSPPTWTATVYRRCSHTRSAPLSHVSLGRRCSTMATRRKVVRPSAAGKEAKEDTNITKLFEKYRDP
jgi:hypothetical protein